MSESARRWIGAVVGGGAGTLAYWLMLRSGIHILAAVGAGVALGVSAASRTRSVAWGVLTMFFAVALSLLVESFFRPFSFDPSLGWFLANLDDLPRNSLVSLLVVALLGFWFGRGRDRESANDATSV